MMGYFKQVKIFLKKLCTNYNQRPVTDRLAKNLIKYFTLRAKSFKYSLSSLFVRGRVKQFLEPNKARLNVIP